MNKTNQILPPHVIEAEERFDRDWIRDDGLVGIGKYDHDEIKEWIAQELQTAYKKGEAKGLEQRRINILSERVYEEKNAFQVGADEERERIVEIIKCLYEGNDAPVDQEKLIGIIEDRFIEPWRRTLKQTTTKKE